MLDDETFGFVPTHLHVAGPAQAHMTVSANKPEQLTDFYFEDHVLLQ
jgi:hypothetical protein